MGLFGKKSDVQDGFTIAELLVVILVIVFWYRLFLWRGRATSKEHAILSAKVIWAKLPPH